MKINSYTINSFVKIVVLIGTFYVKITKNDVQNVHRQPAHKQTNDDATHESLL